MKTNWIPRSKRWSPEERKQKEIEARNQRSLSRVFWNNLYSMREQIEKEIESKRLASVGKLD